MRRALLVLGLSLVSLALAPFLGQGNLGGNQEFIFWQLRIPRVLMGALVGSTLALVGAVYQQILGNPLATPSTVGTMAGATLGALFVIVLGVPVLGGAPLVVLGAFAGALLASTVVATLATSRRATVEDVLLGGIAVSLAASAMASGLEYSADMSATFAATQWALGHLPQVGYHGVLVILPFVAITAITLLSLSRGLQSLVAGEALAEAQGVNVERLRTLGLGMGALGVAACVAWCGPISFVGLIVPHLVRLAVGSSPRLLLPLSWVGGAAFLVGCDAVARVVLPGRDLPVGVVTAALGAPALVLLLWKRAHRAG